MRNKNVWGSLVAATILGVIFTPLQKAEAFVLDVSIPEEVTRAEFRNIPFSISLDIAPGEFISISSVTLAIDEGTSPQKVFTFNSEGRRISGTPRALVSNLEITITPETAVGNGYAYGYGLVSSGPVGSGSPVTTGSIGGGSVTGNVEGYLGPAMITFEGTLRTSLLVEGNTPSTHTIRVSIDTGAASTQQHLLSEPKTFTVVPTVTKTKVTDTATAGSLQAESQGIIITHAKPSKDDDNEKSAKFKVHAIVRTVITVQDWNPRSSPDQPYSLSVKAIALIHESFSQA